MRYVIISGNEDKNLVIDELIGEFLIIVEFDRENIFGYDLFVMVSDIIFLFYNFSVYVIIFVGDVNDNWLMFFWVFYDIKIWEFILINMVIFNVIVVDSD